MDIGKFWMIFFLAMTINFICRLIFLTKGFIRRKTNLFDISTFVLLPVFICVMAIKDDISLSYKLTNSLIGIIGIIIGLYYLRKMNSTQGK
jgi:hypothetical protein